MTVLGITCRLLVGAAFFAPMLALAQPPGPRDDGPPRAQGGRGRPAGGPGDGRPGPPTPPIMAALDTNRDGELSPEEIRNAPAALKSLDRNRDGTLDRSELEPPAAGRGGPPFGPDGPPGGRPLPAAIGRGRPQIGRVLPPFARDRLSLTDQQLKQIADLENDVKGKLQSILNADQLRQLRDFIERGPGGPGGFGPSGARGAGGRGEPPGSGVPDDDGPPVRPQRPRQP